MKQICDGYNPKVRMGNSVILLKVTGMNNHILYLNQLEINQLKSVDQNKLILASSTIREGLNS
jgi:hypothetical protein